MKQASQTQSMQSLADDRPKTTQASSCIRGGLTSVKSQILPDYVGSKVKVSDCLSKYESIMDLLGDN